MALCSVCRLCVNSYRFLALVPKDNLDTSCESPFTSPFAPNITAKDYTRRIMTYILNKDPYLLDLSYYFVALYSINTNYPITLYSINRLMLTSAIVIKKFWGDFEVSSTYAANIGGVSAKEILTYELTFLKGIGWNLFSVSTALTDSELHSIVTAFTGLSCSDADRILNSEGYVDTAPIISKRKHSKSI